MVYLIGALKNKEIPKVAKQIRSHGFEVYDEWWCPGEFADQNWQDYSKFNELTYTQALNSWHAKQVFEIDKGHLDRCEAAILILPAGKSGHIELGYVIGLGKPGYILLEGEPDRYDLMYRFANLVTTNLDDILHELKDRNHPTRRQHPPNPGLPLEGGRALQDYLLDRGDSTHIWTVPYEGIK